MYERFMQLLQENNTTAYKVSKDTGISTATLTDWKKGRSTPKIDKLQKIADYFNVDLNYLLGISPYKNLEKEINRFREQQPNVDLSINTKNSIFPLVPVKGIFEKRFSDCIKEHNLEAKDISSQLLMSEEDIENILSGANYNISPVQIRAAADFFNVNVDWLCGTDQSGDSGTLILKDKKLYTALKDIESLSDADIARITGYIEAIKEEYKK